MKRWSAAITAAWVLALRAVAGEALPAPAFTNLRYDENWSAYDPASGGTWLPEIKRLSLGDTAWVSFGGEARLRWEHFDAPDFNAANDDGYLLYRTFVHADLHFNDRWRAFVQLRFSDLGERDLPGGNREALDYDKGDLWNTFIEYARPAGEQKVTARLGRMELQFGKQRLISPLDWVNNRRIFDGASVQVAGKRWKLDAFAVQPVVIDGDGLTWNDTDDDRTFTGLYHTHKLGAAEKHGLESYLLYQLRDADALVREDLYTLGARAYGPITPKLSYEAEVAWQFGERRVSGAFFDETRDIAALSVSAELKYSFMEAWGQPWLALGLDYASGDGDPLDGDVEAFNPLYPLGHAYFGFADVVSRQNVQAVKLGTGLTLVPKKLTAAADFHWFWRAHEGDGLYNAGGAPLRGAVFVTPGGRSVTAQANELGQELDLTLTYTVNRQLSVTAGYSRFFAGDFLEETGKHDDVTFYYLQTKLTF